MIDISITKQQLETLILALEMLAIIAGTDRKLLDQLRSIKNHN